MPQVFVHAKAASLNASASVNANHHPLQSALRHPVYLCIRHLRPLRWSGATWCRAADTPHPQTPKSTGAGHLFVVPLNEVMPVPHSSLCIQGLFDALSSDGCEKLLEPLCSISGALHENEQTQTHKGPQCARTHTSSLGHLIDSHSFL